MVAHDPAHSPAGRSAAFPGITRPHPARWLAEHRLSRRTRPDFGSLVFKVLAIRAYSAFTCLLSMLLLAWAGAFVRIVSAGNWHIFKTLDDNTVQIISAQAARYQSYLLPVLLSWAVLLLLTPIGYTIAFRMAAVAAGVLGYLHLHPPSFLDTTKVTAISHWLASFSPAAVVYLILAIPMAYLLLASAAAVFGRLGYLHRNARSVRYYGSISLGFTRRLCAMLLTLLVLLSVTWATTVARLAASGPRFPGAAISYGLQGALHQSRCLLVLVFISAAASQIASGIKWLIFAVILTALYNLMPGVLTFPSSTAPLKVVLTLPSFLEVPAARTQLIHIGTAWGADSLWAALFIFVPASVLGIYLVIRLLRWPEPHGPATAP